jgi:hypothetical protein
MTAWILTRENNEYDQYGEYFIASFKQKPTRWQLVKALKDDNETTLAVNQEYIGLLLDGGGRTKDAAYVWYHLREVELK